MPFKLKMPQNQSKEREQGMATNLEEQILELPWVAKEAGDFSW